MALSCWSYQTLVWTSVEISPHVYYQLIVNKVLRQFKWGSVVFTARGVQTAGDMCVKARVSYHSQCLTQMDHRPKCDKFLKENVGQIFWPLVGCSYRHDTSAGMAKAAAGTWDFHRMKCLHVEGGRQECERPPTEWEKIFANRVLDKGLVCRIYKHDSTVKRQTIPSKAVDRPVANEHMRRCSSSWVFMGTTWNHRHHSVPTATPTGTADDGSWWEWGTLGAFLLAGSHARRCNHLGQLVASPHHAASGVTRWPSNP